MSGGSSAFACRMCGQCCEGRGGIVVSPTDEARLCRALRLDPPTFRERYTEQRNGKMHLRVGEDGRCLFFRETGGCSVHVHKPAVCRAWPFFKGNLIDPVSFSLAKEYCPGISRQVAHADFVAEGIQYIRHEELFADDRGKAGAALFTREDLEALVRSVSDSAGERGKQA